MLRVASLVLLASCLFAQAPPQQPPQSDDPRFDQAYNLYLRGHLQEALKLYQEITQADPKFAGGWYEEGIVLKDMKRFDQAVDALKQATSLNPQLGQAWIELGEAYMGQQKWDEAVQSLTKGIALVPEKAQAYADLGYASLQKADLDNAEKYLKKAIATDPNSTQAYIDLGNLYLKLTKTKEGLDTLRKGFEMEPTDRKALDAYAKAVNSSGSDHDKAYIGAWQSEVDKKYKEAEQALNGLIAADSDDFRSQALLGHVYLHQDPSKPNDAITCYLDAIEMEGKAKPDDRLPSGSKSFLLEGLGIAYMKVGEWAKAEETFKKGKAIDKENAWFSYDLAQVMAAQKKAAEAIQYLTEALKADSEMVDEAAKDPMFDSLKSNKDFIKLMAEFGN